MSPVGKIKAKESWVLEGFTLLGFEEEDAPKITRFEKFTGIELGAYVSHGEIYERASQGEEAKAWKQ